MDEQHRKWIKQNVMGSGYGACAEVTKSMAEAFPELRRVRGHYYCYSWGKRTHWWLEDADGKIIDPTSAQFPSKGAGHYEPWDESQPEHNCRCMNCGETFYSPNGSAWCADSCRISGEAYYNSIT